MDEVLYCPTKTHQSKDYTQCIHSWEPSLARTVDLRNSPPHFNITYNIYTLCTHLAGGLPVTLICSVHEISRYEITTQLLTDRHARDFLYDIEPVAQLGEHRRSNTKDSGSYPLRHSRLMNFLYCLSVKIE